MTEIERFRTDVENYISRHKLSPTRFGKELAGDPLFVFQLRRGREPRTETRQKVLKAMQAAPSSNEAA